MSPEDLRWYAVQTRPRQEERANANLRSLGVETLFPVIPRKPRVVIRTQSRVVEPLFPGYLFVRCEIAPLGRSIAYTRGVARLLSNESRPIVIDDEIITTIQSRIEPDGYVRVARSWAAGDTLRVNHGPLSNLIGVFEQYVGPAERAAILLSAVSAQYRVVIDVAHLERCEGSVDFGRHSVRCPC